MGSEKENHGFTGENENPTDIKKYFSQIRLRLILGLVVCFTVPHLLLSAYFHFQFTSTLKKSGELNLAALSESQRNTIDLFLQERVVNLFSLFRRNDFSIKPTNLNMDLYLQSLRQASDAFIDVGFLCPDGIQTGYSGPYTFLQGKNYRDETWFNALMNHEKEYYISDIYLGFRKMPHFTIAVTQVISGRTYVMRATIDPDKFYMFLRTISHGREVESFLINTAGLYQIVDPAKGNLLEKCDYMPPETDRTGVHEISEDNDSVLVAHAWLKEAPWALIVKQPLKVVHARMYHARNVIMGTLCVVQILILSLIVFSVLRLIGNARKTAESKQQLQYQLIHASKLAAVGELATGVAHEINNPLAIITSTSGVIRDMLNPEFNMDASPENLLREVDTIEGAAFRARNITRQLLTFGRKNEVRNEKCNVNYILNDIISGLKEREFKVADIDLMLSFDESIPETYADQDKLRQVFLNLINNAGDAIKGPGKISITTRKDESTIYITVQDSGEGMTPDQMQQIFNPFFTTKETGKGTGLGLSISLSIVESMGGTINVQSLKGKGSAFRISLPIRMNEEGV